MEVRDYLSMGRRYAALFVAATLLVGGLGLLLASLQEPQYRAAARLLLLPNNDAQFLGRSVTLSAPDQDRYVSSQIEVLMSRPVAARAIDEVGVDLDADALLERTSVSRNPDTNVVRVSVSSDRPVAAARLTNAMVRSYIDVRHERALSAIEAVGETLEPQIDALRVRLGDIATLLDTSGRNVASTQSLITEQISLNQRLLDLVGQQDRLLLERTLQQGGASLIERATPPEGPFSPKKKMNVAIGGFLGLALAVTFAFLREQLDDRLRSDDEVVATTGLPVLARLPIDSDTRRRPREVAIIDRPDGSFAESVRGLRTSLAFVSAGGSNRLIVITSAKPGDGKTLVAANLAAALAEAGYNTFLISSDLRRPRIDEVFGVEPNEPGLSDMVLAVMRAEVAGTGVAQAVADVLPQVRRPVTNNLTFISSGTHTPNPGELLSSDAVGRLLLELGRMADVIVLDSPPVMAVTDATLLGARADCTLLVTSLRQTRRGSLARAVATLQMAGVPLMGTVVNMVTDDTPSYYGPRSPASSSRPWWGGRRRDRETLPRTASVQQPMPDEPVAADRNHRS